ncbi:ESCRT-III subunit protein snf7 [Exophiala xenobiotica]|nr:ESCRT-III subunit protein snf7 [Exophiala xenobiotica]KAK5349295.1 ESCRT-III subunit protein snf7 [Exophiala xenobiotica]KAK5372948.1 ESCRT-III subunit protein snf7 [Exophiala xenobiotica]KAK5393591.1 ESCRT-III subunit protein snf7 [Exophiala xenobiotica]KAK5469532.1 ESCRT-III subunit protein snf7 [Exophiala xenobiotica]
MWSWFGGAGAQARRDAPKNAILNLRQQLDMLQKREKHLESQMAEQDAVARKNISTNKTAAKAALRRKKLHERTLEQTSAQIGQIEQQIYSIEAANINQETLNAMKNAGAAMKQIHGNLTIDKVDQTMDELREQHALGEEIANAITNAPIGDPIDEADLEEELEGLEQEAMDERMISTGPTPVTGDINRLPAVSNAPRKSLRARHHELGNTDFSIVKQTTQEEDEEEELKRMQAELAL